jgi:hypothetical protein
MDGCDRVATGEFLSFFGAKKKKDARIKENYS